MHRFACLLLTTSLLLISTGANASRIQRPKLDTIKLVLLSDLIVVGTIEEYHKDTPPGSVNAVLVVDRVIGNHLMRQPEDVEIERIELRDAWVWKGEYGIAFLSVSKPETGSGSTPVYTATDPNFPILDASPQVPDISDEIEDIRILVAAELAQVFATPGAQLTARAPQSGWGTVPDDHGGYQEPPVPLEVRQSEGVNLAANQALQTMPNEFVYEPLKALLDSGGSRLERLWVLANLLNHGHPEFIESLAPLLMTPDTGEFSDITLRIVDDALARLKPQNPEQQAMMVQLLPRLMNSPLERVHHGTIRAMANVESIALVQPLVDALALNDSDIRLQAASGLIALRSSPASDGRLATAPDWAIRNKDIANYHRAWVNWLAQNASCLASPEPLTAECRCALRNQCPSTPTIMRAYIKKHQ